MSKIIGSHIPSKIENLILNGAFDFWQRVVANTTTVNTASNANGYPADRFSYFSTGATVKNYSIVRQADVPTVAQSGFSGTYSCKFTMLTGIASPAAGDLVVPIRYRMEGFDYTKIHSKKVTFGFWVKASVAGTYSFSLLNGVANRSYVTTFVINGSNTWEFKSLSVTLDSTGTWAFDNTTGLEINIGVVAGTTYQGTLNSWQTGAFYSASGVTNYQATTNATLQVTQLSMVEGPLGFSATGFQRAYDTISEELIGCQRYYEKSYDLEVVPGAGQFNGCSQGKALSTGGGSRLTGTIFAARKRTTPTCQVYNPSTGTAGQIYETATAASKVATPAQLGQSGISTLTGVGTIFTDTAGNGTYDWHWTADAEL